METSKTLVNILIVIAIVLIGTSVTSVLIKESKKEVMVVATATTTENITQEMPTVATTTEGTTTEIVAVASTTTSSSTSTTITKGLVGTKWTWVKTTMNASSTTPKKTTAFSITFTATGTLSGTTDCNNFFGTYKSSSNTLTFGPLGATRMFCEGSQESEFMGVLQKVTKFEVNKENNLVLSSKEGEMVFK